jgi:hypothetical protein
MRKIQSKIIIKFSQIVVWTSYILAALAFTGVGVISIIW